MKVDEWSLVSYYRYSELRATNLSCETNTNVDHRLASWISNLGVRQLALVLDLRESLDSAIFTVAVADMSLGTVSYSKASFKIVVARLQLGNTGLLSCLARLQQMPYCCSNCWMSDCGY